MHADKRRMYEQLEIQQNDGGVGIKKRPNKRRDKIELHMIFTVKELEALLLLVKADISLDATFNSVHGGVVDTSQNELLRDKLIEAISNVV